jgi:hypothetical protein
MQAREVTGVNPSRKPSEGRIGRSLRVNVLEPAEARLKKFDIREEELKAQRLALIERLRTLRESAASAPAVAAIRNELRDALDALKKAPPPGTALRAEVLADLWQKNPDLRRDVWMYLIWILLLDLTPLLSKLLAPVGSLDRVFQRREFREITDLASDQETYPELAREIVSLDRQQLLFQKQVDTELAKSAHILNGALETVSNLAKTRHAGHQQTTKAYGADAVNSPEAQESVGVIEAACGAVSEAYSGFLRSKGVA